MSAETCGTCHHPAHEGRCQVARTKTFSIGGWVYEEIVGVCCCGLVDQMLNDFNLAGSAWCPEDP